MCKCITTMSFCDENRCEDAHVIGLRLEKNIFLSLLKIQQFNAVLDEKQLVKKYGWNCCSIDALAIYGDYIIPTQQKWRNSKRRETKDVDNFIKSIAYIQKHLKKKVLFGVWSSRMDLFADNVEKLREWNVVCVSHFDSVDKLVEKTTDVIEQELSKKKEYFRMCS